MAHFWHDRRPEVNPGFFGTKASPNQRPQTQLSQCPADFQAHAGVSVSLNLENLLGSVSALNPHHCAGVPGGKSRVRNGVPPFREKQESARTDFRPRQHPNATT